MEENNHHHLALMADEARPRVPLAPLARRHHAMSSDSSDEDDTAARDAHENGERRLRQWEARRHPPALQPGSLLIVHDIPPMVWAGEAGMSEEARRVALPLLREALADPLDPTNAQTQAIRRYLLHGRREKDAPTAVTQFPPFALGVRVWTGAYVIVEDI
jgi:hypothetical protein